MTARRIRPPAEGRFPEKVNVFALMQRANCQLFPLFGHLHAGAIVSGGVLYRSGLRGDPDHDPGLFFHENSVDEVRLVMGAQGCPIEAGEVLVAGRQHPVGGFQFTEPVAPDACHIGVVTQRQQLSGDQRESMSFRCTECKHLLFRSEYDSSPLASSGGSSDPYPCFATVADSAAAVVTYNGDVEHRTCTRCGHVNPPLPEERWGWVSHRIQSETVNLCRRTLDGQAMARRSP